MSASAAQVNLEFYRQSTLGIALTDSLDEMIAEGHLDPQLAMQILSQFDASIAEALKNNVRAKTTIKGKLQMYRFCDDVWTFVVDQPNFKFDQENVTAEKVKIVACAPKPIAADPKN